MPRKGKRETKVIPDKVLSMSPSKSIRMKCLDCANGRSGVATCLDESCSLWPFRFGKNPFSKRGKNAKPEDRKKRSERMKKCHELKRTQKTVSAKSGTSVSKS